MDGYEMPLLLKKFRLSASSAELVLMLSRDCGKVTTCKNYLNKYEIDIYQSARINSITSSACQNRAPNSY
ncbi:predicted protein [Botrytis cinerea T4]|uniref:Uncharacterized protein n=1 Tax=Botryotinia fuckeliana (strain T4) TaxID=999810 RepID=G2YJB7_BOTF4|nr:predicted protein [Botrytis cinerea T4]